jgi:hypothetical protein
MGGWFPENFGMKNQLFIFLHEKLIVKNIWFLNIIIRMISDRLLHFIFENPQFSKSLPFILMILMTMEIHHDILFYLFSIVELTLQQRNALLLKSLQMQTFLKLICNQEEYRSLLRHKNQRILRNSDVTCISKFLNNVCITLIDSCRKKFRQPTIKYVFKYICDDKFWCNGILMPHLRLLKENLSIMTPKDFANITKMSKYQLRFLQTKNLFEKILVHLANSDIYHSFENPDFPKKIFKFWKERSYIGDFKGEPFQKNYPNFRNEADVIFLVIIFCVADPNFMQEFMRTSKICDVTSEPICASVTEKMRKILYTCDSSEGLGDSGKLVEKPQKIHEILDFYSILYHRKMWKPLFWCVLAREEGSLIICDSRRPLEHMFERFNECFYVFWENTKHLL